MKNIFIIILIVTLLIIAGCSNSITSSAVKSTDHKIILYKSQSCGCCAGYSNFLKSKGLDVEVIQVDNMQSIKDKYNIPANMQSCHTTIIDNYFVEGHMPIEAINKLLEEKPDIEGIALPGMPSGSPGMPGKKTEKWKIYSIKDRSYKEFMVI